MKLFLHKEFIIILLDLLISLSAFWFTRLFGTPAGLHWIVLAAIIWVILGVASGKLQFSLYKRKEHALLGILSGGILSGTVLFFLYKFLIPGYTYDYSLLAATGIIIVFEWSLYYFIRRFFYQKIPYFYEESSLEGLTENGLNTCTKLTDEIKNQDIARLLQVTIEKGNCREALKWLIENRKKLNLRTVLFNASKPESLTTDKKAPPELIIHTRSLNSVRRLNAILSHSNECLEEGGCIACHCTTAGIWKEKIMRQNPAMINRMLYLLDFFWHRIIPKLYLTKGLYFWITKGKMRALTRVEVLGRLYRAGFDVIHEEVCLGKFYVIATKVKAPIQNDKPSCGFLIRLKRKGKDGKTIGVYKLRTMYPYSEYLQPYIFKQEGLCNGGKIADDYRVNSLGKFLRSVWIDELPMLINWIKGDLKLVGVRPLSEHYFSLYSSELQQLRIQTKPGLLPPFYADMPTTLEEIQESEKRYLNAYIEHPFKTDWEYFWKAINNIVLKGKRSK